MKKILISSLLFLTIINLFCQCFAFDIGTKELISLGECERLLTYKGNPIKTTYIVYNKDGINYPAYCLDVTLPGAEGGSYNVNGSSKLQNVDVWRAIINGYPYKTLEELGAANEQEAFIATKQAVYTLLEGRDTSLYGPVNSDSGRRTYQIYLNIVNNARNSTETIVNNPTTTIASNSEEWKIDSINRNFLSKTYNVNTNFSKGNYKIELNGAVPPNTIITDINNNTKNNFLIGEQFKILLPIESLLQSSSFEIKVTASLETKPVVYGSTTIPGKQNYALTGFMYEDASATHLEYYKENITKLIIIKKEYGAEKRLQGVKFNLLNSKKELVKENLITNENGEIILDKMIPGIYYLQEIETLENYNLYTDLIEIKLDMNEEFKVTVDNTTKEIIEVNKKFESVEVVPQYKETIYNVEHIEEIQNVQHIEEVENIQHVKKLPVTGY